MSLYDIHLAGLWTYQYFRAVLSATPLLAELSIQGLVIDHWSADSYERVQLPSLRSLRLSGQETYVSYILFSLSMPHIEHLSLNAFLCFPDTPTYPTISSLVFIRSIPLSRFSPFFPSLTNLTTLHCDPCNALQEIMDSTYTHLHCLESLTFFPFFYWGTSDETLEQCLCKLVNARIKHGYPLLRLRLDKTSWSLLLPETAEMLNKQVDVEVLTQAPTDHGML